MGIEIGFSSSFKTAFKRRIYKKKELEYKFWKKLEIFKENPFDATLRTHKLSGELEGLWSFSIKYDCRIVFKFLTGNKVLLIDIGAHDEIY